MPDSKAPRAKGPAKRTGAEQQPSSTPEITDEAIARRAYEKHAERGFAHGFDAEDWRAAEEELRAELEASTGAKGSKRSTKKTTGKTGGAGGA